jgi:GT2 family glycosyltransferase
MLHQVAIVILNWNGKSFLEKFLPSVIEYSQGSKIYIADNASSDDSILFLKDVFPEIHIIQNEINGGFAKGYNDALKKIESPFYLLLNSDVEVTENWLQPLLNALENPNIAACQPKIISFHDKNKFEYAGASGGFLDRNLYPFCRGRIFDSIEIDAGQYDAEMEIFWASGACFMVRSDAFHQVGGFDEDFFAHMEEIDLCWRLKNLNYSIKVIPSSKVYHVGGGTLNYTSPKKIFLNFRNNLFLITKNYVGNLFFKVFYRMILDGVAAFFFLIQGKPKYFLAIFKAHIDYYKNLNLMLKKRKIIQKTIKEYNSKGFYNGSILWAKYFKKISKFKDLNKRFFT